MGLRLPLTGGCSCGTLRYQVTGQPLMAALCHCGLCQRRTGSAFSMNLIVRRGDFGVTAGATLDRPSVTGSGATNLQHHCAECLVRTHTSPGSSPDLVYVRPGTLDEPNAVQPVAQFWTAKARPFALVEGLRSFAGNPDDPRTLIREWRAVHSVEPAAP